MDMYDAPFSVIVIVVISFFALIVLIAIHFIAIGEVAEYTALNSLVETLGVDGRTEDILGKVADWNMRIASAKRYNRIPVVAIWVPNKIANLKPIIVPIRGY